jgi:hypothetical protein
MGIVNRVAASLAAVAMLAPLPVSASALSDAEKIRRLDIMLMVTGLRCRTGADNFQADYGRFTTNHIRTLNAASATMKAQLAKRYGAGGANRALDKVSVTMANQYGNGHPWLSCGQLKMVAKNLATAKGQAPLVAAADQLLAEKGSAQIAWAR